MKLPARRTVKYGTRWAEETQRNANGCNNPARSSDSLRAQGQTAGNFRSHGAFDALRGRVLFRRRVCDQRSRAHRRRSGAGTFFPAQPLVRSVIKKELATLLIFDAVRGTSPFDSDLTIAAPQSSSESVPG